MEIILMFQYLMLLLKNGDEDVGETIKETIVVESRLQRDKMYGEVLVHGPARREKDSSQEICQMDGVAGVPDEVQAMMRVQAEQARDEALKRQYNANIGYDAGWKKYV